MSDRFIIPEDDDTDVTLLDNETGVEYESNFTDIVQLMNELDKENQKLKERESLEYTIAVIQRIVKNFCTVGKEPTISEYLLIKKIEEQIISGLYNGVIKP